MKKGTQKNGFSKEKLHRIFSFENEGKETYAYLPIFAMVLATYPTLHSTIDKLYDEKPKEYYNALGKSEFRDFFRLESLSVEQELYAKKIIGMFEYDMTSNLGYNTQELLKIVKSRWYKQSKILEKTDTLDIYLLGRYLFMLETTENATGNYFNQICVVEDTRILFAKKHSRNNFLLDEKIRFELLMIFLASGMNKKIDLDHMESNLKVKFSLNDTTAATEEYFEAVKRLKQEEDREYFFERVKELTGEPDFEEEDMITIDIFGFQDVKLLEHRNLHVYDLLELIRYVELIENYTLPTIFLPKNKKEAEKEIELFLSLSPYSKEEKIEEVYYVYFGIFLRRIVQELKKSKQMFFNSKNTENVLEIDWLREELAKERIKTQQAIDSREDLRREINSFEKDDRSKWNEQQQQIEELERKLAQKDAHIEQQNEELFYLREYSYSLEQEIEETVSGTRNEIEEFMETLAESKVVIIGGHPNWKNKMTEILPSLIVVDKETRFNAGLVQTADFVYFQTDNLSHGVFYRTMPLAKQAGVPFGFLPAGNIEVTIKKMKAEWDKKRTHVKN